MKPAPSDYLPFLEAARGHEANARASGSLVDAQLARLMHAEAVRLRQAALYPPERCIDCGATIHSDERSCKAVVVAKDGRHSVCGRARQGVKLGSREVANLVRFLNGALGHTTVTDEIVTKVRAMSAKGTSGRDIAERLDLSTTTVSEILSDKPRIRRLLSGSGLRSGSSAARPLR